MLMLGQASKCVGLQPLGRVDLFYLWVNYVSIDMYE